jgi:hypothetical protein
MKRSKEENNMFAPNPYKHRGYLVRPDIRDALVAYATTGRYLGDFLTAVLENNLRRACMYADDYNSTSLHAIVAYCYNELPGSCWGSAEKVTAWREKLRDDPAFKEKIEAETPEAMKKKAEEDETKRALNP